MKELHTSAVAQHFLNWSYAQHIADLNVFHDNLNTSFHVPTNPTNLIFSNCKIIHSCKSNKPNQLLIKGNFHDNLTLPKSTENVDSSGIWTRTFGIPVSWLIGDDIIQGMYTYR